VKYAKFESSIVDCLDLFFTQFNLIVKETCSFDFVSDAQACGRILIYFIDTTRNSFATVDLRKGTKQFDHS
jgi:hypothetical protein